MLKVPKRRFSVVFQNFILLYYNSKHCAVCKKAKVTGEHSHVIRIYVHYFWMVYNSHCKQVLPTWIAKLGGCPGSFMR
jgi:hypothetical protein